MPGKLRKSRSRNNNNNRAAPKQSRKRKTPKGKGNANGKSKSGKRSRRRVKRGGMFGAKKDKKDNERLAFCYFMYLVIINFYLNLRKKYTYNFSIPFNVYETSDELISYEIEELENFEDYQKTPDHIEYDNINSPDLNNRIKQDIVDVLSNHEDFNKLDFLTTLKFIFKEANEIAKKTVSYGNAVQPKQMTWPQFQQVKQRIENDHNDTVCNNFFKSFNQAIMLTEEFFRNNEIQHNEGTINVYRVIKNDSSGEVIKNDSSGIDKQKLNDLMKKYQPNQKKKDSKIPEFFNKTSNSMCGM